MGRSNKKWNELSPAQRGFAVVGVVVQITLLTVAQRDLSRRADEEVRGPKWLWRLVTMVNFVGPLAYFCCGRMTTESQPAGG